ncbi:MULTISPECIES: hypothetical protein [Brachybacterium]|uniref:Uncharacterized protein n=1 Tax=Brachybacterium conglomeratum TaxID=47846 RepID=A0ABQ5RET0_9MICO|nr:MULTISPECIES: hypothetical protein [Brachybacterium]GLI30379.1 hypothetical protein BCONGLO52_12200 [Brachybacterium conglomeratum]GLK04917.1 hypothetical protein GCM10017597_17170 [Brachybacterium conglomeratum]
MKHIRVSLTDTEATALERELAAPRGWGVRPSKPLLTAEAKILAALAEVGLTEKENER